MEIRSLIVDISKLGGAFDKFIDGVIEDPSEMGRALQIGLKWREMLEIERSGDKT